MKKIFLISKQNPMLGVAEALSLAKPDKYELIDNLLICVDKSLISLETRLGYTHAIYRFLFSCRKERLIDDVKRYDWESVFRKDYCVRVHNTKEISEGQVSDIIHNKLKAPKVNLENPETKIEFFFRKDVVVCGLFISDVDKSYLKRKAHLRPKLHPTSLHPGLARACINLAGIEKGTLLDPFCGSGGILIEAGLMGFNVIGYDIDQKQLERAENNLKHYGIREFFLEKKDAISLDVKADAIVTDFPYGKGSKGKNLEELYERFLINSIKYTMNMVVIFPDFIDHKKIVSKSKWKIKNEFRIYVHKSLTRIILKLIQ